MTKLSELPEDIIRLILSYAPDFCDNYKKCHEELLENRPIYFSKLELKFTPQYYCNIFKSYQKKVIKYVNGLGRRVLSVTSIEVSPEIREHYRIITINYGWGREKDHETWKAVLRGEAGRKNLTTGYH